MLPAVKSLYRSSDRITFVTVVLVDNLLYHILKQGTIWWAQ